MPRAMLTLRRGRVSAVVERHEGLVRLEVDGVPCVAYPDLTGPVALEDDVVVNVQARELGLGSGGFDVLHANLTRGLELPPTEASHVMKLPYTPVQTAVPHAEEVAPLAETLAGMPVVCCSLHSQVAPVCAALAGVRVAYLQLPGGALPVALSDSVRALRDRGLVATTAGVDACFGGDRDCVNVYSALAWAAGAAIEAVVCAIGPGVVGTGSRLGHGGMAIAGALSAAASLAGRPVLVARVSEADRRPRHRGLSHHTEAIQSVVPVDVTRPWPAGCPFPAPEGSEVVDVTGWREACEGLPLAHMRRGPDDDPWFFAAAFAAGRAARRLLR
jgi:Protein of unknown function (DUF3866)